MKPPRPTLTPQKNSPRLTPVNCRSMLLIRLCENLSMTLRKDLKRSQISSVSIPLGSFQKMIPDLEGLIRDVYQVRSQLTSSITLQNQATLSLILWRVEDRLWTLLNTLDESALAMMS